MSAKLKIMYVDDEEINRMLFKVNFEEKYDVLLANDGFEGLKVLDENPETLIVISDMKMPGMNGIEYIQKAKEKYPKKKYYILTGFEITDTIKEALDTGLIMEYFSKPFEVEKMHGIIAKAFET